MRDARTPTDWPPAFRRGLLPVFALVAFFSLWLLVTNGVRAELLGPDSGVLSERFLGFVSSTVQVGIVVAILRYEGVRLRDIGLSTYLLGPAIVAAVGVVVSFNAVVAGLALSSGTGISFGFQSVPPEYSSVELVVSCVYFYLFVGPAEELVFRGYLQNKLRTVFEGVTARFATALAVVTAAVVFALMHVPVILFSGGIQLRGRCPCFCC